MVSGRVMKKALPSPVRDSQRMAPPSAWTQSMTIAQAKAGPGHAQFLVAMRVRPEEALEDGRLVGLRDPEAVVTHADGEEVFLVGHHRINRATRLRDLDEWLGPSSGRCT